MGLGRPLYGRSYWDLELDRRCLRVRVQVSGAPLRTTGNAIFMLGDHQEAPEFMV